ncbi:MAG: hypothetical protein IIZ28_02300 [Erysipelotrichaceae bacterium]|nr:hypothetical protein [Erysipelotrichaceae bacterium]
MSEINENKENKETLETVTLQINGETAPAAEAPQEPAEEEAQDTETEELPEIVHHGPVQRKIIKHVIRVKREEEAKTVPGTAGPGTKKKKSSAKFILIAVLILLLLAAFLVFGLPMIKKSSARSSYEKGRYEEAIHAAEGIDDDESKQIIEDSERQIAERIAQFLLENNSELKDTDLRPDGIGDVKVVLDYKNRSENVSFTARYKNDRYTYKGTYDAKLSGTGDGNWNVIDYSLKDSAIIPKRKCDKQTVDSLVHKEYPLAQYRSMKAASEARSDYYYDLLSYDRPLYKTGYELTANMYYDIPSDSWKLLKIDREMVNEKKIPFDTFVTSIFTIDVPETWILTRNEDIYTWKDKSGEHTNYNYYYGFYPNAEKNQSALNISVFFTTEKNEPSDSGKKQISAKELGEGTCSSYTGSITAYFRPKIRKMDSAFTIYANGINEEELQTILDSIVIKDHSYKLTVIAEGDINIRNSHSAKTGEVVATGKKGNTYTASRALYNEGYTWFNIAPDQWIADQDGEWIQVD